MIWGPKIAIESNGRLLKLNGDWDKYWAKRKNDHAMFLAV